MRNKSEGQHHGPARVMASAPSVVQQARLMDDAGSAWHAVKCGNLEMITKLFPTQCNVYTKGPVGENVMHVAMLLNTPSTLAITRYLVKLYGSVLVNCPVQERKQAHDPPGTYEGQTALHIAIVNRDFDMVKFLVQNGANIRARAWGTFFRPDGPMYYGEYPLSFAACTGQKDIVAYLKRHGAQVNRDCDEHGNTALHMCVYHNQPDMYDFLVDYCAASDTVRNHGGLTPLVLAAQLGKQDILQHIYSRRRRAFYSFGKVTSYSLALREIDTVQDEDTGLPDGGYVPNVLEVVLRKRHLEMLSEPLLTTLLAHKWEAFARTQFLLHFIGYLLLEISQTILIWLHSDPEQWNSPARASQEMLGVILALLMLFVELLDYSNWSREAYHRRLTMTVHKDEDPPLYPIPGEVANLRDGRQSLFARLSARMGFAGHSQGSHASLGSLSHHQRTDSNSQGHFSGPTTPRKAPVSDLASGMPADAPQPAAAGTTSGRGSSSLNDNMVTVTNLKGTGAAGSVVSPKSPGQQSPLRPKQQEQLPQSVQGSFGSLVPVVVSGDDAQPSPFAAGLQRGGSMSPTRCNQQMMLQTSRRSHDDPLNLEPGFGGQVVGEGAPTRGVAVVDSGYTAASAVAAAGQQGKDGSTGPAKKIHLGPGPIGEAREKRRQQQQQQQGSTAAATADTPSAAAAAASGVQRPQLLSIGEGSRHGGHAYTSAANDDEEPSLDVVSVGLPSSRMRSHQALSEMLGSSGNLLAAAAAGGDGGSVPASGRSVGFPLNVPPRSASGRVMGISATGQVQGSPSNVSALLQPQSSQLSQLSTESSTNTIAAADVAGPATVSGVAYTRHRSSASSPLRSAANSADGSSTTAAAAGSSGPLVSVGNRPGVIRAKSFHGVSASYAGGGGASNQPVAIATSGRASTAYSELELLGPTTSSSPADPLEAVQMLERQRTRARSGGGDLPATLSLKRATVTKKEPSNLGPAGGAAAAGGGGGDGVDGSNRGSSFATNPPGGGDGVDSTVAKSDLEKGSITSFDPHKTRLRALLETTYEGFMRMLDDPWLFIWHLHLLLTCLHFLIWISSYGWVGGPGPESLQVRQLDDIIVSMMGLSGWLAVIYFFRGFAATGRLTVVLERCILDVVKFVSLYVLWNLGFSLAFFTIQNGILAVSPYTQVIRDTQGLLQLSTNAPDPFSTIGYSMVTLINLGTGLSHYEYSMSCQNGYVLSSAFCSVYYMLYMATVVLLLLNLLTAMIINTWNTTQSAAEASWRHRWATYVVKAERRLPLPWVQRLRLGQKAWDPMTRRPVYSHVFESVDDDKTLEFNKQGIDGQIKGLESLLEELKKRRSSGS